MSQNCLGDLFLGLGQLALAFLGFLVIVKVIEWPEKAIRWLIALFQQRGKRQPPAPPQGSSEPRWHHNDFDDAL